MVKTQPAGKKGLVKVTFTLPLAEAGTVHVMGDFNDWRPVHSMRRTVEGRWQLTLELERGREYAFKYLLDDTVWINDPDLGKVAANPYGGENSVIAT